MTMDEREQQEFYLRMRCEVVVAVLMAADSTTDRVLAEYPNATPKQQDEAWKQAFRDAATALVKG